MNTTISVDQRFALLSTLGAKTRWNELTVEQAQAGIAPSAEELDRIGRETTTYIRNGFRTQVMDVFRDTGELALPIPAPLPRPTLAELREKFPGIKAEGGIERDDSLVEGGTLKLGTVLLPDEMEENKSISGKAFESRLLAKRDALYGYQHGVWLVEHQDEFPALQPLLGKVYILLPGLVVVREGGYRGVFCLGSDGERWELGLCCLAYGVRSSARVAFSGK